MTHGACTCPIGNDRPRDVVPRCPRHGQAPNSTTAGASRGEASTPAVGIPVVDLTATVAGLRAHAMAEHDQAARLRRMADDLDVRAEFMAELAATLEGP